MRFFAFVIFFSFYSEFNFGQKKVDMETIVKDFTTDSLGCSGLRFKYINVSASYFDTLTNEPKPRVLVSGLDLTNQKEEIITSLFGKANASSHRGEGFYLFDNYWFYLTTCGNTKPGMTLLISVFNGLIDDVKIQE